MFTASEIQPLQYVSKANEENIVIPQVNKLALCKYKEKKSFLMSLLPIKIKKLFSIKDPPSIWRLEVFKIN